MIKKTLKFIAIGLIAAFAVGSIGVVHAQEAKTESGAAAGSKRKGVVPFRGKINEIDKAAKTINIGKEKKRTIQITDQTKITKDGKPATLDDANAGDEVGGAYRDANGKLEASSLRIGAKPEGVAKASSKKKKKE